MEEKDRIMKKARMDLALKINKGFTLLEVMFVIAIIGIIAVFAFPNLRGFQTERALQSEAMRVKADLRYMQQIAFDTKNTYTLSYASQNYRIFDSTDTTLLEGRLERNVVFDGPAGSVSMNKNGMPEPPVQAIITLKKENMTVSIIIGAGGEISIQ